MSMSISAFRFGAVTSPSADTSSDSLSKAKEKGAAAESAFMTEAKKTPAERIREQVLKQMNMTEEDLAKLDDKSRAAVEEAIKNEVVKQAKASSDPVGFLADVTA